MRMRPEALPAGNTILIQNAQRVKLRMLSIEIIGERKCVMRIQPAVVRVAAIFRPANRNHIPIGCCLPRKGAVGVILCLSMILIREITPDDAPAAAILSAELGYPVSPDVMLQRIGFLLNQADHAIYVACLAGNVTGWIDVGIAHHLASEPGAEIGGLVVSAETRSRGIGRLLVARAEQWAVERGMTAMLVRSRIKREAAHRFYLREGYSHTKTSAVFTKQLS